MEKKQIILIVDDVELNRALLRDMLKGEYEIMEAPSGKEAISILKRCRLDIAVVLLAAVMPEMDGIEVLTVMNRNHWTEDIPVVLILSDSSPELMAKGQASGVLDYISRPYRANIVRHRVHNAIMLYAKQHMLQQIIKEQISEREKNTTLMVDILSTIVEFRNGESGSHVRRIRIVTETLLRAISRKYPKYGLTAIQNAEISNAAALHDIGKIVVPQEILNKPGELTPGEFEIMKKHTIKGAEMLKNIHFGEQESLLLYAHDICRWHHERWDGKGYPDGLKEMEIPLCAQVVSLADVYDALVSPRIYKPALGQKDAMNMILSGACGAFNPDLVDCLKDELEFLEEKIKICNKDMRVLLDMEGISKETIARKADFISERTLSLLEQERIKYQFYAVLSNEILFEYDAEENSITFSEKGAKTLGLPVKVNDARQWLMGGTFLNKQDYLNLLQKIGQSTAEDPIIRTQCFVPILGTKKWFEITMRSMWSADMERMNRWIGKIMDIHEQKTEEEVLKKLAECDSLTQLYNHISARKKVREMLKKPGLAALMFLDIDNFKWVNDHLGHLTGDHVLKKIAGTILQNIRDTDIAARAGGDEFIIFLSGFQNKRQLKERVEGIWRALQSSCVNSEFTVSMGVAVYPDDGSDYEALFAHADAALYTSKGAGKNQYTVYDRK